MFPPIAVLCMVISAIGKPNIGHYDHHRHHRWCPSLAAVMVPRPAQVGSMPMIGQKIGQIFWQIQNIYL